MSTFIVTPTNIDFLESIFRDPFSGRWTIPILTFNTRYLNPYYGEIDPINEDPEYQRKIIDHFYFRLIEKWLYKDPVFRKLLKYFIVETKDNKGSVSLIPNIDSIQKISDNEKYRKHIFRYIEKYFITKRLIDKIIRRYVATTHIKYYDIFSNTDSLKEFIAHKLKKLIMSAIYELQDKKKD